MRDHEHFGKGLDSRAYWEREAKAYSEQVAGSRNSYHAGRLATAYALLDEAALRPPAKVLDFGCGDGVLVIELARRGFEVYGIDIAPSMIELASRRLREVGAASARVSVGGVAELRRFDAGELSALISLNVLAYLTDDEEETFYAEAARTVRDGGLLLVSHSNELFDLFALNAGTARFFERNFLPPGATVEPCLATREGGAPYNVRANPLTYSDHLAALGFEQIRSAFFNLHPLPPALLGEGDEGRISIPPKSTGPLCGSECSCALRISLSPSGAVGCWRLVPDRRCSSLPSLDPACARQATCATRGRCPR